MGLFSPTVLILGSRKIFFQWLFTKWFHKWVHNILYSSMLLIAHLVLKVFFFRVLRIWHINTNLWPCNTVTHLASFMKKNRFTLLDTWHKTLNAWQLQTTRGRRHFLNHLVACWALHKAAQSFSFQATTSFSFFLFSSPLPTSAFSYSLHLFPFFFCFLIKISNIHHQNHYAAKAMKINSNECCINITGMVLFELTQGVVMYIALAVF